MKITKDILLSLKHHQNKITMLTSYDYPMANLLDQCEIDVQLIGDSVGTNVLGYTDVTQVTVPDMTHHLKAVVRAVQHSFILCDMPFGSFDSVENTLKNAKLFIETGADGVKIESELSAIDKIAAVAAKDIPVCAHIGYTPQTPGLSASVQGKSLDRAKELISLAKKCEQAGAFMIVLELIPEKLAEIITQRISIPTIGIGAGRYCDGQVQVLYDILGMSAKIFRHAKAFIHGTKILSEAITNFKNEVQNNKFPTEKNTSSLERDIITSINQWLLSKETPNK